MDWIGKAVDALRSQKVVATVAIVGLLLLAIPGSWLSAEWTRYLGIYRGLVALGTLTAWVYLLVCFSAWAFPRVLAARKASRTKAKIENAVEFRLQRLDWKERIILREFHIQDRNRISLSLDDAAVTGLIRDGVLRIVGPKRHIPLAGFCAPLEVTELYSSRITIELLGLPAGPISAETKQTILSERPSYIYAIEERERVFGM